MKKKYKIIKLNDKEFENLKVIVAKELLDLRIAYSKEIDEIEKDKLNIRKKQCGDLFTILNYVER